MRHTVFLLHGMGNHAGNWAKDGGYLGAIKEAYDRYPALADRKIEDRFEFIPISYAHIFAELAKTWATNAAMIQALAAQAGNTPAIFDKLTGWLGNAGELNKNFVWTHAVDVMLYRGSRLVREAVCMHVANQLVGAIKERRTQSSSWSWSIVAHSLGTAVTHDTLARIGAPNHDWPGRQAFSFDNEKADVVMMVANVSRLLALRTVAEPYDAYGSKDADGTYLTTVAPGYGGQPGRACDYYLNVRHTLDPFTVPRMFNPQGWPDRAAALAEPPRYQYREVDHIHQANVHDFAHYFKHPDVHIPFFRLVTTHDYISEEETTQARDDFPRFGLGKDGALAIQERLKGKLPAQASDWFDFGAIFKNFP